MSTNLINSKSASYSSIRANIEEYLQGLKNWEEIKDLIPPSNMTLIKDLMAGFGAYISQRQNLYREETYLSTAKMASSVYNIANVFGYTINRYTSPSVRIKYNDTPTITLTSGDVLGTYGDLDVVYFGPNKVIEKLDLIDVFIGRFFEKEVLVAYVDGQFNVEVKPEELISVDRDNLRVFLNDIPQEKSQLVEDYIVFNKVADYSLDPFSTNLFVSDIDNTYGVLAAEGSVFRYQYLETNGFVENLKTTDVALDSRFLAVEVSHVGTTGDSLDKIKRLAPLLYSTLRRMVTEDDHKYIAQAHPYIASASAERDLGQPYKASCDLVGIFTSDIFSLEIDGVTYSYTGTLSDTKATCTQKLFDIINTSQNESVDATLDSINNLIILTSTDSRNTGFYVNGSNVTVTVIDENVKSACCTVNIYYVLKTTVDDPVSLTPYERNVFANYLNTFKMVGLKIVLIPATVNYKDIMIKIKLTDPNHYTKVMAQINSILTSYELKTEKEFDYGTFLVEVANLKIFDDDGVQIEQPVTAVIPNQVIYDVAPSKYSYLKFDTVEVILE